MGTEYYRRTDEETAFDRRLGAAIRDHRNSIGMSQKALADAAGITFQQVQKYERGSNRISVSRLRPIAAALGLSPGMLIEEASGASGSGTEGPSRREAMALGRAIDQLPDQVRSAMRGLVRSLEGMLP